jgi:chorismate mutase
MAYQELTPREIAVLRFEAAHPVHDGAKEEAIRKQLRMRAARYAQVLNAVIDKPAALALDPLLVKRLLNAREARTQARARREFRSAI